MDFTVFKWRTWSLWLDNKENHELALTSYASGNSDARYLAGIIAVPFEFSKKGLKDWALAAGLEMI